MPVVLRSRLAAAALCCLAALPVGAGSAAEAPVQPPLPKTLAGLALGMSEADFRKARPAAKRFEIFDESEVKDDPNPWYTEPLQGDPFFDLASYTFGGHRLCAVALSALGRGEPFRLKQAKVLQGSVQKWGGGYERVWQMSRGRKPKSAPVKTPALLWKLGSYRILAKFSDARATDAQGEVNLAIMDLRCLPARVKQGLFNSLVPANGAAAQAPFKILEAQVEPPLFE